LLDQLGAIRSEADAVSDELKKTRERYEKAREMNVSLERELSMLRSTEHKAAGDDHDIDHQVSHDTCASVNGFFCIRKWLGSSRWRSWVGRAPSKAKFHWPAPRENQALQVEWDALSKQYDALRRETDALSSQYELELKEVRGEKDALSKRWNPILKFFAREDTRGEKDAPSKKWYAA
jgi:hypothetical protein